FSDVRKWSGQLMDEGLIESVWTPQGIHWAPKDHVPNYVSVYAQRSRLKPPEEKVLSLLKEKPLTHKELLRKTKRQKDALNETLHDFFDTFLEAGMVLDIWNHTTSFDYKEWTRRRSSGDILEGRFLNGRVRYVRAHDVPLFLSAFPRSPLTEFESKVLDVIRASVGIDIWGITSKLREEKERVKEALDKLDYDVYVIRKFQGDGWTARNLYTAFDPPAKEVKDAVESLVKRFLAAYGPVPFSGIREWARFEWDELERLVDRLEEQGLVTRILVTGKAEGEMYVLAQDLPALRKASGKAVSDPVRVLSLLDP